MNSYNNIINKDANEYVRKVNVIMRKNRRILSSLMNGSDKEKLLKNSYYSIVLIFTTTPIFIKPNKARNTFNYELDYLELEEEQFTLLKTRVR